MYSYIPTFIYIHIPCLLFPICRSLFANPSVCLCKTYTCIYQTCTHLYDTFAHAMTYVYETYTHTCTLYKKSNSI